MAKLLTLQFSHGFFGIFFQKSHSPCRKKRIFENKKTTTKNNKKGGQVIDLWWPSYRPYSICVYICTYDSSPGFHFSKPITYNLVERLATPKRQPYLYFNFKHTLHTMADWNHWISSLSPFRRASPREEPYAEAPQVGVQHCESTLDPSYQQTIALLLRSWAPRILEPSMFRAPLRHSLRGQYRIWKGGPHSSAKWFHKLHHKRRSIVAYS